MVEAKKKAKRVLKPGYKRVRTASGAAYYINEKTHNRVKKSTATKAAKKRTSRKRAGTKRRARK